MRRLALVVLLIAVGFSERNAAACGGAVISTQGTVGADAQRIFLSVHGGKTDIVVEIGVPQSPADYGALIPLPAEPTLDPEPVPVSELEALDDATRIDIVHPSQSSGCSCGFGGAASKGNESGVIASLPVEIGPVTAVTLTGGTGAEVAAWLSDNGYQIPAAYASTLDEYAGSGRYFIALRRTPDTTGGPDSIGIHFTMDGDQRAIPLRFTRIGAGPTLAFTIFLLTPTAAGPSPPFKGLTVDKLLPQEVEQAGYGPAIEDMVTQNGSAAFFIEDELFPGQQEGLYGEKLATLVDGTQFFTRWTTVLHPEAITMDADFYGTAPASVQTQIILGDLEHHASAAPPLFLFASLWTALRLRRSRRAAA